MLKATLIGNLGQDAVVNNVNGTTVINFSACHTEKYKNREGVVVEKGTWVNCSYFTDKTAVAQYLKKGTQVYVEGTPEAKTYTQRNGQAASSLNLRVTSIQLLGGKKETTQQPQSDLTPSQQEFLNQPNGFEPSEEAPF